MYSLLELLIALSLTMIYTLTIKIKDVPNNLPVSQYMHKILAIIWGIIFITIVIGMGYTQVKNYTQIRSDILERGILAESPEETGAEAETYMMDNLILHVYCEDPKSPEYIAMANKQYEQWENLTLTQYLKKGIKDLWDAEQQKSRTAAIKNMDPTNPTYWEIDIFNPLAENKIQQIPLLFLAISLLWQAFCFTLPPIEKRKILSE